MKKANIKQFIYKKKQGLGKTHVVVEKYSAIIFITIPIDARQKKNLLTL